jgi:hypothetical protein
MASKSDTTSNVMGGGRASLSEDSLNHIIDLLSISDTSCVTETSHQADSRRRYYLKSLVAKHYQSAVAPTLPSPPTTRTATSAAPPTGLEKVRLTICSATIKDANTFKPQGTAKKAVVFPTDINVKEVRRRTPPKNTPRFHPLPLPHSSSTSAIRS